MKFDWSLGWQRSNFVLVLAGADELESVLYMDAAYSRALGHAAPCRARIDAVESSIWG